MAKKATKPAKKTPAKAAARKSVKQKGKKQQQHAVSRVDVFVQEYLVDLNGYRAAIRAGYSPRSARQTASELLAEPHVQAKVQAAMDARAERTGITADRVLERYWGIATADARELIELHRGSCRYCWGKDHRFQRTQSERDRDYAAWCQRVKEANGDAAKLADVGAWDEAGGVGFHPYIDPNPKCPECFGEGLERVVPKDTRDLSPGARTLFAGVKTTQHGLEIKMHDQLGALRDVGRHLGLFKDKIEHTGKNGGPIKHALTDILDEIDGEGTGIRHGRGAA